MSLSTRPDDEATPIHSHPGTVLRDSNGWGSGEPGLEAWNPSREEIFAIIEHRRLDFAKMDSEATASME